MFKEEADRLPGLGEELSRLVEECFDGKRGGTGQKKVSVSPLRSFQTKWEVCFVVFFLNKGTPNKGSVAGAT